MTRVPVYRAPRIPLVVQAQIWAGRHSMMCQTVNLSETGLLLIPPFSADPGLNLRVDLPLPGLTRPLALPAVLVREGEHDGEYAWGVKFELVSSDAQRFLKAFLQEQLELLQPTDACGVPFEAQALIAGADPVREGAIILPPEDLQAELASESQYLVGQPSAPTARSPILLDPEPLEPMPLVPAAPESPPQTSSAPQPAPTELQPLELTAPLDIAPRDQEIFIPRPAPPKQRPIDRSAARRVKVRMPTGSQPRVQVEPASTAAPVSSAAPPSSAPQPSESDGRVPGSGSNPAVPQQALPRPPTAEAILPATSGIKEEPTPAFDDVPEWRDKSEVPIRDRDLMTEAEKHANNLDSIYEDALRQLEISDRAADGSLKKKKKKRWF